MDCYVAGFGAISEGGSASDILKSLKVNIYDDSVCSEAYGSSFNPAIEICAGES